MAMTVSDINARKRPWRHVRTGTRVWLDGQCSGSAGLSVRNVETNKTRIMNALVFARDFREEGTGRVWGEGARR